MNVSWTDDTRRLHRLYAILTVIAIAGHFLPPWGWL